MKGNKIVEKTIEATVDEYYGVEHEIEEDNEVEDSQTSEKPFDAEKIRIDQQMLSVKYIYELMEGKNIELNPDFQRYPVWKDKKENYF